VNIPDDGSTVLDGFTITGGNAGGAGSMAVSSKNISRQNGGGMYNNSSSPVLTNVTISGNSADYGGGMYNYSSSPALTNVTISGNSATGTHAYGGGMYNYSSSPALTNVTISGNSADRGGGMYNRDSSSPMLTNVTISGNSATGTYAYGGGMHNESSSSPVLTNVTISGNSAANGGGMNNNTSSSPKIRNSIIWGNTATTAGGLSNNNSSTPVIASSIVQDSGGSGSWVAATGTNDGGNLDTDPLFEDWTDPATYTPMPNSDGDYRLGNGSPAINAGNDILYPANADDPVFPSGLSAAAKAAINAALATDLDGNTRKQGAAIDMGAYEKQ
jgi:hypothetical protein